MNKLSINRQTQIIKVLCEGNSIRSTARITDTAIKTVVKLLKDVGLSHHILRYYSTRNRLTDTGGNKRKHVILNRSSEPKL